MSELRKKDELYIANTYARFPVDIVSGKGSIFKGADGKKYVDLGTGIGVTAFGACDKTWQKAVKKQLGLIQHTSNLYYTEPCVRLAELLVSRTGLNKVFFANSGAEANECAIKVARKYAEDNGKTNAKIITLVNSFHGRTITTLSATGQEHFHKLFTPLTDGFLYATANDIESVQKLFDENEICGVMIECVQGEGGVNALDKDFVTGVKELCEKSDALLIVDEVQTGNGRCGTLYAYMDYGITPDVITTAKGLGGGLPIGACIIGQKAKDTLGKGDHGSTYGGNPVCAAGAISVISRIDDKLLSEVKEKSKMIIDALTGAKGVESVTGKGLMLGIKTTRSNKEIVSECMENGVLVLTAKDKVRLLPALNIPKKTLMQAIEVIKTACAKI